MNVEVTPIRRADAGKASSELAAIVTGLDLRRTLGDDTKDLLEQSLARFPVLVFPGQCLDDEQQLAFTRTFGEPQGNSVSRTMNFKGSNQRTDLYEVSNVDEHGRLLAADDPRRLSSYLSNRRWHTDNSFLQVPAKVGILNARQLPPGGATTEFADMRAAWDALAAPMQSMLLHLQAEHSLVYSRGQLGVQFTDEHRRRMPAVSHPLVRRSARSGRSSLYLSAHASHILGMPVEEGRQLMEGLKAHATQARFCYVHEWALGDIVVWDNRCTMHRAGDYDDLRERRVLARTGVNETQAPAQAGSFT